MYCATAAARSGLLAMFRLRKGTNRWMSAPLPPLLLLLLLLVLVLALLLLLPQPLPLPPR
jgi:hypothetical protein